MAGISDDKKIDLNQPIAIISGEGISGSAELYKGKKSVRALKSRLARERCHGDRWATVIELIGVNENSVPIGYDISNDCTTVFPDELL